MVSYSINYCFSSVSSSPPDPNLSDPYANVINMKKNTKVNQASYGWIP